MDAENSLQFIVDNKILSLNLNVVDVFDKLWLKNHDKVKILVKMNYT